MRNLHSYNKKRQITTRITTVLLLSLVVALIVAGDIYLRNSQPLINETVDRIANESDVEQEGKNETKPSAESISSYKVAPDQPRVLSIKKLDLTARLMPMGINSAGNIQAPQNTYDTGWYSDGNLPGQPGAVLVDGHASGPTRIGIFAYLDTLSVGDIVEVELGNGQNLVYGVTHLETTRLEDVNMKKALAPYGDAVEGLNLITCTGAWIDSEKTYDHRVIVYTERVQ